MLSKPLSSSNLKLLIFFPGTNTGIVQAYLKRYWWYYCILTKWINKIDYLELLLQNTASTLPCNWNMNNITGVLQTFYLDSKNFFFFQDSSRLVLGLAREVAKPQMIRMKYISTIVRYAIFRALYGEFIWTASEILNTFFLIFFRCPLFGGSNTLVLDFLVR